MNVVKFDSSRISEGREFQAVGPEKAKQRSANLVRRRGREYVLLVDERRPYLVDILLASTTLLAMYGGM